MLCRLYDPRSKSYIPVDETMGYLIHPVGAVLYEMSEDTRIVKELSTQKKDLNGQEIYAGDTIADKNGKLIGEVAYFPKWGMFGIREEGQKKPRCNSRGKIYTLYSFGRVQVIGTIHDEEMEAV